MSDAARSIPTDLEELADVEAQTTMRGNYRTDRRGRFGWSISPGIARASVDREKKIPESRPEPAVEINIPERDGEVAAGTQMSAPLRVLGEASTYDELIVVFRDRADELDLTRAEIDRLSGLPDGYAGKTLCRPPVRRLGHVSLEPTIGTLAVRLIVVEDPEQTAKILARRGSRQRPIRPQQET